MLPNIYLDRLDKSIVKSHRRLQGKTVGGGYVSATVPAWSSRPRDASTGSDHGGLVRYACLAVEPP